MSDGFSLRITASIREGQQCFAALDSLAGFPVSVMGAVPPLRAGDEILVDGIPTFRVLTCFFIPGSAYEPSMPVLLLEALGALKADETITATVGRKGFALAWITLSDKGAQGKRHDESGPLIAEIVGQSLLLRHVQGFILPDDESKLRHLLVDLALGQGFDLIMTTGGTGVAPRDITPEATLAVIEKRLSGYERAMTAASLSKTPHGAVSRAVAGTLGQAIIVNMPGSPKAVRECLEPLVPTLSHTLEKLHGDPSDCARLRRD